MNEFNFHNMCLQSDPDIVLDYLKVFVDKQYTAVGNSYLFNVVLPRKGLAASSNFR